MTYTLLQFWLIQVEPSGNNSVALAMYIHDEEQNMKKMCQINIWMSRLNFIMHTCIPLRISEAECGREFSESFNFTRFALTNERPRWKLMS